MYTKNNIAIFLLNGIILNLPAFVNKQSEEKNGYKRFNEKMV